MEVYCDCGEQMTCVEVSPDQESNHVLFECEECGASLGGEHRFGNSDGEDD